MYHSGLNPLKGISRDARKGERVDIVKGEKRRRLHKAFLRYHDPANWPLLRDALKAMGRADLIGNGQHHLIPTYQPSTDAGYESARRKNSTQAGTRTSTVTVGRVQRQDGGAAPARGGKPSAGRGTPAERDPRDLPTLGASKAGKPPQGRILTQHTGLPPRETGHASKAGPATSKGRSGSRPPAAKKTGRR